MQRDFVQFDVSIVLVNQNKQMNQKINKNTVI